jgi:hypothetical protein
MENKKPKCKFNCLARITRQDIGVRRFLNTGKPYVIERCINCKREYVREL